MSCCGVLIMPDFETLQARPAQAPFRLTGWHVGTIALVFFVIVAAMNGVMMSHAFRTMPGLDARNGYDVSQRYNTSIHEARFQAARGWRTDLNIVRQGNATLFTTTILDRQGEPIRGLTVAISVRHPATRLHDYTATARELAPGSYEIIHRASAGNWDVEISAKERADLPPLTLSRNRITLKD